MPKISIIVPVYKVEKYLHRCLDSIIAQTFTDWECILIDDGSPDGSGKICDEYAEKDERFKVFHQENQGVSAARNKGLDEARGEYVNFIDSDDWIANSLLEKSIEFAMNYEIVFWGNYNCYEDGDMVAHIPHNVSCSNIEETECEIYHLKNNAECCEYFGYTWNKMFRMSVIRNNSIKFVEGLTLREDELFTMEYCQNITSLKVISESLYYYRHCMGLTNTSKSSATISLYADKLYQMTVKWKTTQLRELDFFRYSLFMYQASCAKPNLIKRLFMSIQAYKLKKKYYRVLFQNINAGAFKYNILVGVLYSLCGIKYRKQKIK